MLLRQEVTHRNRIIEYKWRVGCDARASWREIICGTFKTWAWRDWVRLKTRTFVLLLWYFILPLFAILHCAIRCSFSRRPKCRLTFNMKAAALTFIAEQKKNLRHCPRPTMETEYDQYVLLYACCLKFKMKSFRSEGDKMYRHYYKLCRKLRNVYLAEILRVCPADTFNMNRI